MLYAGAAAYLTYVGTKLVVDNAPEIKAGLEDVFNPPAVPNEQEAFVPPPPDPRVYDSGPTLGGEFTGPLHLPGGSTADLPDLGTGTDLPLQRPEVLGDGVLQSRRIPLSAVPDLTRESWMGERPIARGKAIHEVKRLIADYGGSANNWRKMSTYRFDYGGEDAEIHWYENRRDGIGIIEESLVFPDEEYFDDSDYQ